MRLISINTGKKRLPRNKTCKKIVPSQKYYRHQNLTFPKILLSQKILPALKSVFPQNPTLPKTLLSPKYYFSPSITCHQNPTLPKILLFPNPTFPNIPPPQTYPIRRGETINEGQNSVYK